MVIGTDDTLIVPAVDGEMYRVVVTRSDLPESINACIIVDDTVKLSASAQIDCSLLLPNDSLFQCLSDTLRSDTNLIQFTGCFSIKPYVFVVDSTIGGKGCIGDTLKIDRLYIADGDRDLGTTDDRDTCIQHFLIVDSTAPAFTFFPNDTTIDCNADTSVSAIRRPTAGADNCLGTVSLTRRDSIVAGICPAIDTILRIWKVSDSCNNNITRIQRIIRLDTKPPVPDFIPRDTTVACLGDVPLPVLLTGTDSCGGSSNPYRKRYCI
jgi:hypothetical protein